MKSYRGASLYEVTDVEDTTCRVFAAYFSGCNVGFLTVDDKRNTIELVYVMDRMRGEGIATALLDMAREVTGLSLDRDTGERTPEGTRWAKARGLSNKCRKRITKKDIARQIAMMTWALMAEPEEEEVNS